MCWLLSDFAVLQKVSGPLDICWRQLWKKYMQFLENQRENSHSQFNYHYYLIKSGNGQLEFINEVLRLNIHHVLLLLVPKLFQALLEAFSQEVFRWGAGHLCLFSIQNLLTECPFCDRHSLADLNWVLLWSRILYKGTWKEKLLEERIQFTKHSCERPCK